MQTRVSIAVASAALLLVASNALAARQEVQQFHQTQAGAAFFIGTG